MTQLCISYSLAIKLIGSFGVTVSILMINILVTDFFSAEEPNAFSITVESWTLFGLNWTYFVKNIQKSYQAKLLLFCVLFYAGCSFVANTMLCLAAISKRPNFLVPWIYIQIISIMDQSFAIFMNLFNSDFKFYNKSNWSMSLSSSYLLLSAYFLLIVRSARKNWLDYPERTIHISTITRTQEVQQGFNLPKSPSYLADQNFINNSPNYTISAKYEEI
ncbi:uncharacterized protein LOC127276752 [Leptopilina boulardi]|uniref:uncharacterized protein LOC127276752 n=1 Tax=Leptopilina boulardi TaxID=63433 RepID=UPI0021F508F3|nr:uncharacterized protein LOC127276752 [Leptopilina boulardi]